MNKYTFFFLILIMTSYGYCQKQIYLEKTNCFFDDCDQFSDYPNVEFGYLYVPEDYNNPGGKYIKIAFSIVKSMAANPKPDPILIFGGGWGNPNLDNTLHYWRDMPVKNRDIILYDYRGSGYSKPNLCPDLGKKQWNIIRQDYNYKIFTEKLNRQYYNCFDELEQQGIDYRLYGTEIKTIDAVKLIEHMGYNEVNLFGISNGTMGIQGFIRASENSAIKIRSIFSDSNVPMTEYLQGDLSLLYKQVLDNILDDCANNPECESTYPRLKERFYNFLRGSLKNPVTYQGEKEFVFNTHEINSSFHQLLYNSSNHKDLPLLLEAFITNDLTFIDALYDRFENLVKEGNGTSIINYVYDWKARQKEVIKQYKQTQEDSPEFMWADFYLDFYSTDTKVSYNPRDTIPVISDIPAIVLAGTYDPITSVEYSRIMHRRYSNSYYFELAKVGHGVFMTSCGKALLKAFIEQPDKRPSDECVNALESKTINFTTSLYKNSKVNRLIQEVGLQRNGLWIILLLLPLLFSFILSIKEIINLFRKKEFNALNFSQSLFILIFLIGLSYFSFETIQLGGLTLLFGLVDSAWWLPWCSSIILILGLFIIYRMISSSNFSLWNVGVTVSSILVGITIFTFKINLF